MHEMGIVHRDLKLDNILINDKNEIKLIDFGFATGCKKDEKLSMQCGTPQYMCPDLARNKPYSAQMADVWALGVMLFIMSAGKLPFAAEYEADLYRKIQNGKYTYPVERTADNAHDESAVTLSS